MPLLLLLLLSRLLSREVIELHLLGREKKKERKKGPPEGQKNVKECDKSGVKKKQRGKK